MIQIIRKYLRPVRRFYMAIRTAYYLRLRHYFVSRVKLEIDGSVSVNQATFLHGSGCVKLGNGIVFGFVHGGYYSKHVSELIARKSTSKISLGDRTLCNNNLFISAWDSVTIGEDCLIGHNCEFSDANGHEIDPSRRREFPGLIQPIVIGNNVWFGHNCKILKGTRIGDNSIVAAGAVVSGEFSANVIIGGVPAKVLRALDTNE